MKLISNLIMALALLFASTNSLANTDCDDILHSNEYLSLYFDPPFPRHSQAYPDGLLFEISETMEGLTSGKLASFPDLHWKKVLQDEKGRVPEAFSSWAFDDLYQMFEFIRKDTTLSKIHLSHVITGYRLFSRLEEYMFGMSQDIDSDLKDILRADWFFGAILEKQPEKFDAIFRDLTSIHTRPFVLGDVIRVLAKNRSELADWTGSTANHSILELNDTVRQMREQGDNIVSVYAKPDESPLWMTLEKAPQKGKTTGQIYKIQIAVLASSDKTMRIEQADTIEDSVRTVIQMFGNNTIKSTNLSANDFQVSNHSLMLTTTTDSFIAREIDVSFTGYPNEDSDYDLAVVLKALIESIKASKHFL